MKKTRPAGAAVCASLLLACSTLAQIPASQPVQEDLAQKQRSQTPSDVLHNERLTGDSWGARNWLQSKGIDFSLSMTAIYQHNARGGLDTHNGHDISGSVDAQLTLDFEQMELWKGGVLYVLAESSWNRDIGIDKVGNLFKVNGDAYLGDYALQVSELWFQQSLLDDKVRVKVGKMDLMIDFDLNAVANDEKTQFLNPALVNMGNIPFPDYAQGIMAAIQPANSFYLWAAIADAQANGRHTGFDTLYHDECHTFSILELGLLPVWKTPWGRLPGGYRLMLWYKPEPRPFLTNTTDALRHKTDDVGFAFNMDQMLWKENPASDDDAQAIRMFFRYGYAHDDVHLIEHFWSMGAQYRGIFPTRDDDILAFAFAQGIIGNRSSNAGFGDRESIYELYYNIALLPWLSLTPDFQWIHRPGGTHAIPDSLVVGLRMQMSF